VVSDQCLELGVSGDSYLVPHLLKPYAEGDKGLHITA
jgi:hypothetical protein